MKINVSFNCPGSQLQESCQTFHTPCFNNAEREVLNGLQDKVLATIPDRADSISLHLLSTAPSSSHLG